MRKANALQLMTLISIIVISLLIPRLCFAAPELNSDTEYSTAGYFQLSWSAPSSTMAAADRFLLQQAENPDFNDAKTLYQGPDRASLISGLADRTYYYRVRLHDATDWSETLAVEVKHHALSRAFGFFILGAIMFLITTFVLLKGANARSENIAEH